MNKNTLQAISLLMAGAVFLEGVPLTAAGAKAKIKEKKSRNRKSTMWG